MTFKTVAGKIGLSVILLVLVVLLALYVSLDQLFIRVLYVQGESRLVVSTFAHVQWLIILAGIGSVMLASGLTLFLSNRLASPLIQMESVTKEISKGNYHKTVPVQGEDEIARLGRAINDLARHLDHLESTRKEFLADISHELRTPLTYIRGYSQVLFEHLVSSENEQDEYLKLIFDESERIEQLIVNLFSLAQADEGTLRVSPEPVDIAHLADKVIRRMQRKAADKSVTLQLVAKLSPVVSADPLRIEQVLFNLIDNAIQYNREGGYVDVRIVPEETHARISISDSGLGIPASELPFVWGRLYRVEKSRSRQLGGTGLGLAIVRQIVEQHGGVVEAMSEEGIGSTFSFILPLRRTEGRGGTAS